jgi:predicted flap endonuclease-1-like 5' DNA nuclease
MPHFPDRNVMARIRARAEESLRVKSPSLTFTDSELIGVVIEMCDHMIQIAAPPQIPDRLEMLPQMGKGTARALRAHGIDSLSDLALLTPDDIIEICDGEGVKPPDDVEAWSEDAAQLARTVLAHAPIVDSVVQVDESAPSMLEQILGIGTSVARALQALGIHSFTDLLQANMDDVKEDLHSMGLTPGRIGSWQDQARDLLQGEGDYGRLETPTG